MGQSGIIGAAIAFSMLVACAADTKPIHTLVECNEALTSFAVVPTTTQNIVERREMLATIKTLQEEEFADCENFSGWKQKFERAYQEAIT